VSAFEDGLVMIEVRRDYGELRSQESFSRGKNRQVENSRRVNLTKFEGKVSRSSR